MGKNNKNKINLEDYISKKDAAKEIVPKVFFTKISGIIGMCACLLIYGCFVVNQAVAFVCVAIFMSAFLFIIFRAEQNLNYFCTKYNIEKPVLIKRSLNVNAPKN